MRGWWRSCGLVAGVALICSCSAHQNEVDNAALGKRLEQISKNAVTESIEAQRISPSAEAALRAQSAKHTLEPGEPLWIQSGRSRLIQLSRPVRRVSIGDPEIASVVVLGPYSIMITAKQLPKPQQIELPHYTMGGITVTGTTGGTLLGKTLTPEPRFDETTLAIWDDRGEDSHTLTVADFTSAQVMLEVTVAEINRTAMEEHGIDVRAVQNDFIAASFFGGAGAGAGAGGTLNTIPPQVARPLLPLTLTSDKPTYAFIFPNEDVTALVTALQTEGLASILAQPKIMAMSGQNALFQVGGEIPIRIATGFAAAVEFKPFGTLVNFVPRVSEEGDIVLTVTPEVSEPDFSREVEGVPTFIVRRASTTSRLHNGETLVIGGLLQKTRAEEVKGVPYLKDIPFLGYFFRHTQYNEQKIEMLVVVTPHLIHPRAPGETVPLPTDRGPMTVEEQRTKPSDAETTRPRIPGLP